jgi:hypothetical protein
VALHLIGRLGLAKGHVPGSPNPQAGASGNKRQQDDQRQDSLHQGTVWALYGVVGVIPVRVRIVR